MECGLETLDLLKPHRLGRPRDGVVVPVEKLADRINSALDVHVLHGSHDVKLEVGPVVRVESRLLTFAHLFLILCVHEIRLHEAHQLRVSSLRDEAAETIDDEDATRVDTGQFGKREVERRSAPTRIVQA